VDSSSANPQRRRIIRLIVAGAAIAPFAENPVTGMAAAADVVKETDPAAVALMYKADATKSADRKNAAASCDNCVLYTGNLRSPDGACVALATRLVAAKGWCNAWEGY
jgi:hypothetical protein